MKIYHVPGTRSMRPLWLCYELGVTVEVVKIDYAATYRDSPEWRAISPAGKVPILEDGELRIFESGAMVEYILDKERDGTLRPAMDSPHRPIYNQWCWYSEATLSRPMGLYQLTRATAGGDDIAQSTRDKVNTCMQVVEDELADKKFLLGDEFSAADIMMGYTLYMLNNIKLLAPDFERSIEYMQQLTERPAFQKTL